MALRVPKPALAVLAILLVAGAAAAAYFLLLKDDEGDEGDTVTLEVPSASMLPAIDVGDLIEIDRKAYRTDAPAIGDIVVFHPPLGSWRSNECGVPPDPEMACPRSTPQQVRDELLVMRVVAGPGDEVSMREGKAIVDGEPDETEIAPCVGGIACNLPKPITIPPGDYFLLGDNRGSSDDSRFWGPIPGDWIVGKVTNVD